MKSLLSALIAVAVATSPALAQTGQPVAQGAPNVPEFSPAFPGQTRAPEAASGIGLQTEVLARGLNHPWGIAALPGGGYLVTERSGDLRAISADGALSGPIDGVPQVLDAGQGGLLDVAIAPDFAQSRRIVMTYAKPVGRNTSTTALAEGILSADMRRLTEVRDIFVGGPPSSSPKHYGSRAVFGPDGSLFMTLGEHSSRADRVLAQDNATTYGKVIRLNTDGSVPADNPFRSTPGARAEIWSTGHRNPQGAAIHPDTGQLWTVEHGPAGGDELNIPQPGANFGWPVVSYGENYGGSPIGEGVSDHAGNGFVEPVYYWDPVIAPGGMIFYDGAMFPEWQGNLLISGLRSQALVRLELDGERVTGEERLLTGIGRVRDVEQAPDGSLILLIDSNRGAVVRVSRDG